MHFGVLAQVRFRVLLGSGAGARGRPVLARVLRWGAIGAAVVGCWRWCGRIWMAGC